MIDWFGFIAAMFLLSGILFAGFVAITVLVDEIGRDQ